MLPQQWSNPDYCYPEPASKIKPEQPHQMAVPTNHNLGGHVIQLASYLIDMKNYRGFQVHPISALNYSRGGVRVGMGGVGWGWCLSCRGGVGHVGGGGWGVVWVGWVGWGGVGHVGVGWVGHAGGGVGHVGVGWVMQGWGGVWVGWGGSCSGGVGHVGVGWVIVG